MLNSNLITEFSQIQFGNNSMGKSKGKLFMGHTQAVIKIRFKNHAIIFHFPYVRLILF
jgi:hypothetical protein